MENLIAWGAILLLVAGVAVGWILTLLGMPGNWLMLLLAGIYAWLVPSAWRIDIGVGTLAALACLAALGELLEFVAGAWGTRRAGGSRRAAVLALIGSMIGGVVGLTVGLPLPPFGPLVGVLLLVGLGAAIGAVAGERWVGQRWADGWKVGKAAFWARLLGTAGKVAMGSVMVVVVLAALFTA